MSNVCINELVWKKHLTSNLICAVIISYHWACTSVKKSLYKVQSCRETRKSWITHWTIYINTHAAGGASCCCALMERCWDWNSWSTACAHSTVILKRSLNCFFLRLSCYVLSAIRSSKCQCVRLHPQTSMARQQRLVGHVRELSSERPREKYSHVYWDKDKHKFCTALHRKMVQEEARVER